jgi:hypothetical protein
MQIFDLKTWIIDLFVFNNIVFLEPEYYLIKQ